MPLVELPPIPLERAGAQEWVTEHLGHLSMDDPTPSPAFVGGQQAADQALLELDISGYARRRSMVHPPSARGASKLSPYIRHGLIDLKRVWKSVDDASSYDRFRYQGELLWQDYARHWYAVYGRSTRHPISHEPGRSTKEWDHPEWWREMECIDRTLQELEQDGWCVNQTRMWLASQYSVRASGDIGAGEHHMFQHLLDGSRAANRMGWQWMAGTSRSRAGGFARQQVRKRAPDYCASCKLQSKCPIAGYAKVAPRKTLPGPTMGDPEIVFGPADASTGIDIDFVWLTAESLGDADPALVAHPESEAAFVFDEGLLSKLQLSGKRLIFLAETLADLSTRRDLKVFLGDPKQLLAQSTVATTFAPVPGFARLTSPVEQIELHPWPWLRVPTPAFCESLNERKRFPSFKDWCRLTKVQASR